MVVGYDNIDVESVIVNNVVVMNILNVFIEIIVELGFILMFVIVCCIVEVEKYVEVDVW